MTSGLTAGVHESSVAAKLTEPLLKNLMPHLFSSGFGGQTILAIRNGSSGYSFETD